MGLMGKHEYVCVCWEGGEREGDREKEREQADDFDSCVHTDGELYKVKGKAGRP